MTRYNNKWSSLISDCDSNFSFMIFFMQYLYQAFKPCFTYIVHDLRALEVVRKIQVMGDPKMVIYSLWIRSLLIKIGDNNFSQDKHHDISWV